MPVVRDQDDGAFILIDRLDEGGAAVHVEMVGGLVEDQEMRAFKCDQIEQEACLLTPRQRVGGRFLTVAGQAEGCQTRAALGLGRVGHQFDNVLIGRHVR